MSGELWVTSDVLTAARLNQKNVFVGTSAPGTTYAGQLWFDSINNILYERNKDNNAWLQVYPVTVYPLIGSAAKVLGITPIIGSHIMTATYTYLLYDAATTNGLVTMVRLYCVAVPDVTFKFKAFYDDGTYFRYKGKATMKKSVSAGINDLPLAMTMDFGLKMKAGWYLAITVDNSNVVYYQSGSGGTQTFYRYAGDIESDTLKSAWTEMTDSIFGMDAYSVKNVSAYT